MKDNNKYKININPETPSKESIKKRMDFKNAHNSYSHWIYRTPWHTFQHYASKNKKTTMMILLFAVIAMLIVMDNKDNKDNKDNNNLEQKIQTNSTIINK